MEEIHLFNFLHYPEAVLVSDLMEVKSLNVDQLVDNLIPRIAGLLVRHISSEVSRSA